jgi:hypothetical protein
MERSRGAKRDTKKKKQIERNKQRWRESEV